MSQLWATYGSLIRWVQPLLIAETVHALTAIDGHGNPPTRHIVLFEGLTAVKEKLKSINGVLEDFIKVSNVVHIAPREPETSEEGHLQLLDDSMSVVFMAFNTRTILYRYYYRLETTTSSL